MKKIKKYRLCKNGNCKYKVKVVNYSIDGYHIKPKNKIEYDGITVNSMIILDLDLIKVLLKKKIKKKLDIYLKFLISVLDEEDTDPGHLMFALNDLDRYRRLIINNYQRYLEDKYVKILNDKMDLLEQELRSKIKYEVKDMFKEQIEFELEEPKKGKSR